MISDKNIKEKEFEEKVLATRYKQRFTIIKLAKIALANGDAHQAIRNYQELFDAVCHHHKIKIFDLSPAHFSGQQAPLERLLMSQAFYDMARLTDLKIDNESIRNTPLFLNQFVKFTINQPYQSMNTRTLFQHLRKTKFRNRIAFESTHKRILAESRLCFFANYCFGDNHPITNHFRALKIKLLKRNIGINFVRLYYSYSDPTVRFFQKNKFLSLFIKNIFFRPLLILMYLTCRVFNV